jgi:hypothetical protein
MQLQQINKEFVKPIPLPVQGGGKVLGEKLFADPNSNVFLLAKKKSGKTSTLFKIIKKCSSRKTKIFIFCATVHKDRNWIEIVKWLEKHHRDYEIFTSILETRAEGRRKIQVNNLRLVLDELKETGSASGSDDDEEEAQLVAPPMSREAVMQRLVGEAKREAEEDEDEEIDNYMVILDDMTKQLRRSEEVLEELVKTNRHYKIRVLVSSQYLHDLKPEVIEQMDYIIMFGRIPDKKLERMHDLLNLSVDYDDFLRMYQAATDEKYHFLYIDTRNEEFRRDFTHKIVWEAKKDRT